MSAFQWQRAVIKVGSALVAPDGEHCSAQYLLPLARFVSASRDAGKQVIIVSSGSVAAGRKSVPVTHSPSIAEKQAMAAIGQTQMMANWARFFDVPCAQILLTADDLSDRARFVNVQNTLRELLKHDALPIVNENDSVATNEIKVGDNDNLAAYTALVAQADTLIMCSDIDGLFTADPRKDAAAKLIPRVTSIDDDIRQLAGGAGTRLGTGGMKTKIEAAEKCTQAGIQTLIVNGRVGSVFDALLNGECPGTLFEPVQSATRARTQWLKHSLKVKGKVLIDEGASNALTQRNASLLPSGIKRVEGHFSNGDLIEIVAGDGTHTLAKGLTLYSSHDLNLIKGLQSRQIESVLGYTYGNAAVHKDDLVLIEKTAD
ncbi:glutamate 5-kinase [Alteromonas facilis]|uniref:glutamate 5-kinase n=1 Tax=Alteromonas facilis TaxID=2048004 RepID=UPI000C2841F7|nr:glutamate 5-kinase [Alteromonas facilis]